MKFTCGIFEALRFVGVGAKGDPLRKVYRSPVHGGIRSDDPPNAKTPVALSGGCYAIILPLRQGMTKPSRKGADKGQNERVALGADPYKRGVRFRLDCSFLQVLRNAGDALRRRSEIRREKRRSLTECFFFGGRNAL